MQGIFIHSVFLHFHPFGIFPKKQAILLSKESIFGKEREICMKVLFRHERPENVPVEEDFSRPTLMEDIEKTRYALEIAYAGFDNATDPDLIDCYIYEVNSLLKRYSYLTALAQKEEQQVPVLCPESPIRSLIGHVFG